MNEAVTKQKRTSNEAVPSQKGSHMTKVKLQPGIQSLWGRMGDWVFRRSHTGETHLSLVPDMSRVQWSPAQQEHRQRFRKAVAAAKIALADPEVRARYEAAAKQAGKRPFDMAVSDQYHGRV